MISRCRWEFIWWAGLGGGWGNGFSSFWAFLRLISFTRPRFITHLLAGFMIPESVPEFNSQLCEYFLFFFFFFFFCRFRSFGMQMSRTVVNAYRNELIRPPRIDGIDGIWLEQRAAICKWARPTSAKFKFWSNK